MWAKVEREVRDEAASTQLMCTHSIYPHHIYAVDNRWYMLWTTVVHSIW